MIKFVLTTYFLHVVPVHAVFFEWMSLVRHVFIRYVINVIIKYPFSYHIYVCFLVTTNQFCMIFKKKKMPQNLVGTGSKHQYNLKKKIAGSLNKKGI